VLKKAVAILTLTCLLSASGGHLVLIQGVAWSKMLIDYSKQTSFGVAIQETFDGEHPCEICKKVEIESKKQQKQETKLLDIKKELFGFEKSLILIPVVTQESHSTETFSVLVRNHPPQSPPPKIS
jgi:hypothetical protein